jgi:hypothetical protein
MLLGCLSYVCIVGSKAGYTMLRGSVKSTGYPFHSPVSPSLPLPCVTVCQHVSTGLLSQFLKKIFGLSVVAPAEVSDWFAFDFYPIFRKTSEWNGFATTSRHLYCCTLHCSPPFLSKCSASSLRTTKACESFHAHIISLLYSALPNIFLILFALQKIRDETYIKMVVATEKN